MGYQDDFTQRALAGLGDAASSGRYLGPALVVGSEGGRTRVRPSLGAGGANGEGMEEVWAEMAMPLAYQAEPGDSLLVIGEDGRWYVIGVLRGSGRMALEAPGDIVLSAPAGRIELAAADGVAVRGSIFEVVCETVSTSALHIAEQCRTAARRVARLLEVSAGQTRTVVDEEHMIEARTIVASSRENTIIDGRHIHLG